MEPGLSAAFPPTRWSLVKGAALSDADAATALGELCRIYWKPLYAFIRRSGKSSHDAEDLTQAFLARVIETDFIAKAREDRGKLRSFMLTALKRFLATEHTRSQTQKRGGGAEHVPIDVGFVEEWVAHEPAHDETPEREYDRHWALTLLDAVMQSLEAEYVAAEKGALFQPLRSAVSDGETEKSYGEIAAEFGMSESAVKMAVYRVRQRYRQLLRQRIADTVETPEEIDDEIAYLIDLFG